MKSLSMFLSNLNDVFFYVACTIYLIRYSAHMEPTHMGTPMGIRSSPSQHERTSGWAHMCSVKGGRAIPKPNDDNGDTRIHHDAYCLI